MRGHGGWAAVLVTTALAALAAGCAPAPKDDGTVLTLPPTTAASTPTTAPPVSLAATIQLRISGPVRKTVALDKDNVCVDDRAGTVSVHGAAADGTVLDVALLRPASGRFPLAVAPAPGTQQTSVTKLSLKVDGKDYTRPSSGDISIADAQARRATVVVQAFAENPAVKMTADWSCATPPAPAAKG